MKFIEDDFDLEIFKKTTVITPDERPTVKHKLLQAVLTGVVWLVSLALAFVLAYFLFRGGQYLIDLFL